MPVEKFLLYSDDKIIIKQLENFDLSTIRSLFEVSFFERQLYKRHTLEIKNAIVKRKLFDRIITVMPVEDKKYKIIDGQHRLDALFQLYKEGLLKSYPLTLRIINAKNEKEARDIYLALDSSKALTSKDVLKVYDDGKLPFFNNLRDIVNHYGSQTYMTYLDLLGAYNFATSNIPDIPNRDKFESLTTNMEICDIERLNMFVKTLYSIFGRNTKNFQFKVPVFRSLCKVFYKHFEDIKFEKKWMQFLLSIASDQYLNRNSREKSREGIKAIFEYLDKKY
jgi:hypothetical protein